MSTYGDPHQAVNLIVSGCFVIWIFIALQNVFLYLYFTKITTFKVNTFLTGYGQKREQQVVLN